MKKKFLLAFDFFYILEIWDKKELHPRDALSRNLIEQIDSNWNRYHALKGFIDQNLYLNLGNQLATSVGSTELAPRGGFL